VVPSNEFSGSEINLPIFSFRIFSLGKHFPMRSLRDPSCSTVDFQHNTRAKTLARSVTNITTSSQKVSQMNVDPEDKSDPLEASFEPQTTPNPPDPPRKRKRKFDQTEPLDSPVDEAIAEYLATPKSIRQFKSFSELAEYFSVPAQQGFERLTTGRVASHAAPARRRPRRTPPLAANRGWTSKGRNCRKYQSRGILQRTRVV
jgi:hypothetical protein